MLRWMLRVDSWFDVASLENMEEDHNFLFLKKNLVKIFFWLLIFFFFEIFGNLEFFKGIENFDWWFFFLKQSKKYESNAPSPKPFLKILFLWKQPKKYEPNAPSPKAFWKFSLFFSSLFLFFLKYMEIFFFSHFKKNWKSFFFLKILSKDEIGLKVMTIYSWWFFFFFFGKPILRMRITLAGSWCGLLDKSLLNSYKKIISISNGFIHWNELEVLTQCP